MSYILKLFFAITFIILLIINTALSKPIKIIVLGDSLVAGYGLLEKDGFVRKLEEKTQNTINDIIFFNGGVSGETSSGLRTRLNWVLEDKFDGVIVAIGANDALRGISPQINNNNIDIILKNLKTLNIPTMLIGMKAPNNLGVEYVNSFNEIYPILSKKYKTYFYPFFLSDVALVPKLNQQDMIHPNKQGVNTIVRKIFPYVLEFINSLEKS
jgi:acyl-CoA thioesterase-1